MELLQWQCAVVGYDVSNDCVAQPNPNSSDDKNKRTLSEDGSMIIFAGTIAVSIAVMFVR